MSSHLHRTTPAQPILRHHLSITPAWAVTPSQLTLCSFHRTLFSPHFFDGYSLERVAGGYTTFLFLLTLLFAPDHFI
ncbi:hypothetical protein FBQ87_08305 [Sphingobacteriales bacterium CHB3]|nr:hypothetical protein [Sphingobacteriales bacterium CHB3]